mgnify:FL=1
MPGKITMNSQTLNLTFTLTVDEINFLLNGLQEIPAPAKVTGPLTQKIKTQAEEQIKQLQEAQSLNVEVVQ